MSAKRVMVTVPEKTRARMLRVGERVNWSAVAARAFEKELAEIEKRARAVDIDVAVHRLIEDDLDSRGEDYRKAFEAGRQWAFYAARLRVIRSISQHREDYRCWGVTGDGNHPIYYEIFDAVEKAIGCRLDHNHDALSGFVSGVCWAYSEVRKRVTL